MLINLSIKNVRRSIVEHIRKRAKMHHRSLQGELLAILEETITPRRFSPQEIFQRIRASGLKTGSEATSMVREDRDGR